MKPVSLSGTPGTGTFSSLTSPQSEHSQSSLAPQPAQGYPTPTVSSPSTGSSYSGSSSEVVSVLENTSKGKATGQAPLLITPPAPPAPQPAKKLNQTEPVPSGTLSSSSSTSDRPPLISACKVFTPKGANHERTVNSLSTNPKESTPGTGERKDAEPISQLARPRPEDESSTTPTTTTTAATSNNLDLCHRVKGQTKDTDTTELTTNSNKASPKKSKPKVKGQTTANSSPPSSPEKGAGDSKSKRPTRTVKGATDVAPGSKLSNGLLPSSQSAPTTKRAPSGRKSTQCDPLKLDKLFLPAFALATVTKSTVNANANASTCTKKGFSTCSESSSASSSSNQTSTPPSTASSTPSSLSPTNDGKGKAATTTRTSTGTSPLYTLGQCRCPGRKYLSV